MICLRGSREALSEVDETGSGGGGGGASHSDPERDILGSEVGPLVYRGDDDSCS